MHADKEKHAETKNKMTTHSETTRRKRLTQRRTMEIKHGKNTVKLKTNKDRDERERQ